MNNEKKLSKQIQNWNNDLIRFFMCCYQFCSANACENTVQGEKISEEEGFAFDCDDKRLKLEKRIWTQSKSRINQLNIEFNPIHSTFSILILIHINTHTNPYTKMNNSSQFRFDVFFHRISWCMRFFSLLISPSIANRIPNRI